MRFVGPALVCLVLLLASPHDARAQPWGAVTPLPTLGGTSVYAININNIGDVVGYSTVGNNTYHAFRWNAGQMHDLGTLPGHVSSLAWDVNNLHQVVGVSYTGNLTGTSRAVLWDAGKAIPLNSANTASQGWVLLVASAINDNGQIVGIGVRNGSEGRGYLLDDGVVTDLGPLEGFDRSQAQDINRLGDVLVTSTFNNTERTRPGVWRRGILTGYDTPAGFPLNFGFSINDKGDAVGIASLAGANYLFDSSAVLYSEGGATVLPPLGNKVAVPLSINNVGHIVGRVGPDPINSRAVLWRDGQASYIDLILQPGYRLVSATAINDAGQATAILDNGRSVVIQLAPTQEGATILVETLLLDHPLRAGLLARIATTKFDGTPHCGALTGAKMQITALRGRQIDPVVADQLKAALDGVLSIWCTQDR